MTPYECPHCKADLTGGEIPADVRWMYGGFWHYSRVLGRVEGDCVVEWSCPDCGGTWAREVDDAKS